MNMSQKILFKTILGTTVLLTTGFSQSFAATTETQTIQSAETQTATEQPTTETISTEVTSTENPTTEIPTTEAATSEAATTENPTSEKMTTEAVTTEKAVTNKATVKTEKMPSTEENNQSQAGNEVPGMNEQYVPIADISKEMGTYFDIHWLNPVYQQKAYYLLGQMQQGKISQSDFQSQVTNMLNAQIEEYEKNLAATGGKIDLNQSPYTEFNADWLTRDRQNENRELYRDKTVGNITQTEYNAKVSELMNAEYNEMKQTLSQLQNHQLPDYGYVNTNWLNDTYQSQANDALQQYKNGQLTEQQYLTQVADIMTRQLGDFDQWLASMGGKVDLNKLPAGDFDASWLSPERMRQLEDLAYQKDFGNLSQSDFNDKVSALMNDQLDEFRAYLADTKSKIQTSQQPGSQGQQAVTQPATEEKVNHNQMNQSQVNQPQADDKVKSENKDQDLPDTGEKQSYLPLVAGVILLAGASLLFFTRRRAQK